MRIAVLNDIHGNLPALEAVLAEVDADLVVVGGDVAAGPMPVEVLDILSMLTVPVRWVLGSADREILNPPTDDESPSVRDLRGQPASVPKSSNGLHGRKNQAILRPRTD